MRDFTYKATEANILLNASGEGRISHSRSTLENSGVTIRTEAYSDSLLEV
jgi:hypothetical protein